MWGILIIVILVLLFGWIISTSNRLNRMIVKIDEADAGIDVALTKRYDALTKLIEVVKGYAKHEKETLFEVVNLRQGMTMEEKNKANHIMDENMHKAEFLVEEYPDLKASTNYLELQASIVDVEEHLQAARRLYNSNISIFNQMIVSFPTSIIAKAKGLVKKDFFEAEEEKKKDVEIKF